MLQQFLLQGTKRLNEQIALDSLVLQQTLILSRIDAKILNFSFMFFWQ